MFVSFLSQVYPILNLLALARLGKRACLWDWVLSRTHVHHQPGTWPNPALHLWFDSRRQGNSDVRLMSLRILYVTFLLLVKNVKTVREFTDKGNFHNSTFDNAKNMPDYSSVRSRLVVSYIFIIHFCWISIKVGLSLGKLEESKLIIVNIKYSESSNLCLLLQTLWIVTVMIT